MLLWSDDGKQEEARRTSVTVGARDFEPDLDVAVVVDFELGLAAGELPHDARTKAAKSDAMILPGNRLNLRIIDAAFLLVGARNDCTRMIAD